MRLALCSCPRPAPPSLAALPAPPAPEVDVRAAQLVSGLQHFVMFCQVHDVISLASAKFTAFYIIVISIRTQLDAAAPCTLCTLTTVLWESSVNIGCATDRKSHKGPAIISSYRTDVIAISTQCHTFQNFRRPRP